MRSRLLVAAFVCLVLSTHTLPAATKDEVASRLRSPKPHPRLFLHESSMRAHKRKVRSNATLTGASAHVIRLAQRYLKEKPIERELRGKRLLAKSRTCLLRVLYLSYAYRMTGEKRYADRAKREMLAAAQFRDWNPKHFLDVGEMTAALAIGYDWCYPVLSEADRTTIRNAVIVKGLKASFGRGNWWVKATNNWNQVCHAGLVLGALAIMEHDAEIAAQIIARAVNCLPIAMGLYEPAGAYPEGPSYWEYGTEFNVLLLAALESALGTDFGLTRNVGFMRTAQYMLHVHGPTGLRFNYADASRSTASPSPAMFWLAARTQDQTVLWWQMRNLEASEGVGRGRLFPLLIIWAKDKAAEVPRQLHWLGKGKTPVAFHRSSWEDDAAFVAIKGGQAGQSHGHMDAGSFVIDMAGQRWADDLGLQSYYSLESKGVDLWGRGQNSQRWKVFRIGAMSHNVLTVDGKSQNVRGKAEIVRYSENRAKPFTIVDLSPVYLGDLAKAQRGVRLLSKKGVLIQDEITGSRQAQIRWAMLTHADVKLTGKGDAILSQKGKKVYLSVLTPPNAKLEIYDTKPRQSYDCKNPGTRMVGFKCNIAKGETRTLVVQLSLSRSHLPVTPLAEW